MGHIMELRKHIGHDPLIGVGATTLVFNDKQELLLNLRAEMGADQHLIGEDGVS